MGNGYRQEVFNVLLAQLLQERGVISAPEGVIKATLSRARSMPDVIVHFYGLRTAIEGEVSDQPNAEGNAVRSARKRVLDGIAHIGIAVIYPESLRKLGFAALKSKIVDAKLQIAVITEAGETGFTEGNVDYLEQALKAAYDQLVKEDVVAQAVALLNEGIEAFIGAVMHKPGIVGRMAKSLGIRDVPESHVSPSGGEQD